MEVTWATGEAAVGVRSYWCIGSDYMSNRDLKLGTFV